MKLFRILLCVLLLTPLQSATARVLRGSGPFPSNNGGMLLGLGPPSYFSNGPEYLNWAQSSDTSPTINLVAGGTQSVQTTFANGQMDSGTGELVPGAGISTIASVAKPIFTPGPYVSLVPPLNGASPWWNGLAMTITWTGTSTVTQQGTLGSGSTALSCGANSCTFTFGSNPSNAAFIFAITNVNDPPKNIFVYETKFAANVSALASCIAAQGSSSTNCNHFSPDWISVIKAFGRLRTMDIMNVNGSGPSELSQLADFNYQICVGCGFNGIGTTTAATIDNGSGSAGNTLTISGNTAQSNWAVGQTVSGPGVTGTPVITALGTGAGGNGTYTVSGAAQLVASTAMNGTQVPGTFFSPIGTKGGIHPSWAVELSKVTGADIHYNLPVNISNQGMTDVATYFRNNMPSGHKVFFELGNENWNPGLGITYRWLGVAGNALFGGTTSGVNYGGYRMSQLMTVVQGVYGTNAYDNVRNPTGQWAGVVGGQMVNNTSVPAAFVNGFTTWQASCSCSTKITDLFYDVVVAPYFSDFPSVSSVPANLQSMITASAACFASIGGSITASASAGVLTVSAGSVTLGQGLTGAGLPANLYINSGSGPYNLNQSVTVGSESMTTVPCADTYQFFAQQYSKLFITGSNDFAYTGSSLIPITGFQDILNTNALFANSYGLQLSEYEGGNQVVGSPQATINTAQGYLLNWQWNAAGNDPLYTPALVYQGVYQMLRNVHSAYSAKFVEQNEAYAFSGVRYLGDSNPSWSAIVAENALGPYVDPTVPGTWTATYAGNATNRFFSASTCSGCTDTLAGVVIGTAATRAVVAVSLTGGSITSVTCDGVTSSTPDAASSSSGRTAAIYSMALSAGTNTRTCSMITSAASFQNREFYVSTATGLLSGTPLAINPTNPGTTFPINYTKAGLLVATSACAASSNAYGSTSGVSTPSTSSPTTQTIALDDDTTHTASFGMFNAPFSSAIFSVAPGCAGAAAGAVYK